MTVTLTTDERDWIETLSGIYADQREQGRSPIIRTFIIVDGERTIGVVETFEDAIARIRLLRETFPGECEYGIEIVADEGRRVTGIRS